MCTPTPITPSEYSTIKHLRVLVSTLHNTRIVATGYNPSDTANPYSATILQRVNGAFERPYSVHIGATRLEALCDLLADVEGAMYDASMAASGVEELDFGDVGTSPERAMSKRKREEEEEQEQELDEELANLTSGDVEGVRTSRSGHVVKNLEIRVMKEKSKGNKRVRFQDEEEQDNSVDNSSVKTTLNTPSRPELDKPGKIKG